MLRIEDRLRIALGSGMGVHLDSREAEIVCRMLVHLRKIRDNNLTINMAKSLAADAIKSFDD
jgi:hypothetical protein